MADTTRDITLRLEGKVDTMACDLHDIKSCLNGNGKPGLKNDVFHLQNDMEIVKKLHGEQAVEKKETGVEKKAFSRAVFLLVLANVLSVGISFLLK